MELADLTNWNIDLQIPRVQQKSSNDCGVFTIVNAYSLYNQIFDEFTTGQLRKKYAEILLEKGVPGNPLKRSASAHPNDPFRKLINTEAIFSKGQGNTAPTDNSEGVIPVSALSQDVESKTFVSLKRSSPGFGSQGMGSFQRTSPTPFLFGADPNECIL